SEGSDTFHFQNLTDGADIITDLVTGLGGDVLDVADLLIGFTSGSDTNEFVQFDAAGGNTAVRVDAHGPTNRPNFPDKWVLAGLPTTLTDLIAGGNIELGG